jgi:dipeptidyl-peptidase-4
MTMNRFYLAIVIAGVGAAGSLAAVPVRAQDRLAGMPGYERYAKMRSEIAGSVKRAFLQARWVEGGKAFEFSRDGKSYRYDIAAGKAVEAPASAEDSAPGRPFGRGARRPGGVPRARQLASQLSPDGKWKAFYRDRNLWLSDPDGKGEIAVTTEGSDKARTKFGTATWDYGEELDQSTAFWWSPDSRKLAYYGFDESKVPDYVLQLSNLTVQGRPNIEAYPHAGVANPVVDLYVYDLDAKKTVKLDVRDGEPFADNEVGHYVYDVSWSPDGRELLFHRTNRKQNVLEIAAADPATGKCRTVVREEWPASWVDNHPPMQFLKDRRRFLFLSDRTGFRNITLYDLSGKLLATLTNHPFEVANIVQVDERAGVVYYTARSGDNHMKLQLHRVGLDGKGDRRITDPALNHQVSIAPDGRHFVDVAQTHDRPPATRLLDGDGRVMAELAASDLSRFDELGLKRVELFTFTAADGVTPLHGMLHRPSNFDSTRTYPVLVSVYGGPATNGASETFTTPHPYTELGFLVVTLDARSAAGRGKKFLDAIYQKLGVTEIDDMAAGIRALRARPYVDGSRVGIFGTSYGGYASAMALLRHPEVFAAASAMSPVTDWRNYDTIYTERYMWTPQGNRAGYDAGSAVTYADSLRGRLMLYYGTADNNVHPANSLQLISALQRARKSFDVQVGPDRGHTALAGDRMLEFFIQSLVLDRATAALP